MLLRNKAEKTTATLTKDTIPV